MKKMLGGGLALAFAAAGTMLFASPGGTETNGILEATISPAEVQQGGSVTVTGDACDDPGTVDWAVFLESDPEGANGFAGARDVPASGGLSVTYTVPRDLDPGTYAIQVTCGPFEEGDTYAVQGSVTENAPDGNINFRFDVTAAETTTPPTTAPPAAPAAPGRPAFTG